MSSTTKLHSEGGVAAVPEIETRTVKRVMMHLIPFLMCCYFFAWLNRINVSFGALQMNKALGLTPADYGLAAGLFFVTYAFLEVPSNLMLHKVGARRWIARIMISWGIIASCMALVKGSLSFDIVRMLLGAAEAGFYPGILFFLTLWIPSKYRAQTYSFFLCAIPITTIIGAPLSVHILTGFNGIAGMAGWQWMFIIEGLPTVIIGAVVLFYLQDKPSEAKWLAADESKWLISTLAAETATIQSRKSHSVMSALSNPTILLMSLFYFSNVLLITGETFFLPLIMKGLGYSPHEIGNFLIIPNVLAFGGMLWWGRRSDKKKERVGHAALSNLVASIGLIVAILVPDPYVRAASICISWATILCTVVPFWAIPSTFLSGSAAAGGIGAISAMGVSGGFVGNWYVGYLKTFTGGYEIPLLSIAGFGVVISVVFWIVGLQQQRALDAANVIADARTA
jgi:sugar phosphate permease